MVLSQGMRGGLAAAVMLAAGQAAALGQIEWRSGATPAAPMAGQAMREALTNLALNDSRAVVQFDRPIVEMERTALSDAGLTLLAPLGNNAFFATVDAQAATGVIVGAAPMVSVQPIDVSWKLDPMLGGEIPAYAIVENQPADPVVAVYVVYHRDVDLDGAIAGAPGLGMTVMDALETINGVVAYVPQSQIVAVAADDDVQWVELAMPKMSTTNAENRVITQVDQVQSAPYDLDGTGVTAFVYDGGKVNPSHSDFSGRATLYGADGSGTSDHATHVAGTIGGDGSQIFNHRGMAPNVSLLSSGFEWTGGGIFLYENPGDIEMDYTWALGMGADVANNSIGSNTEPNGFPCSIQGNYGVTATVIDSVVRGSLGEELIVVWANGNERQGSSCDIEGYGDYYSTAPPAGAKNHITVGALNANNDSMTGFSSWGPVDDGRMKPDISGPGCQQGGDGGITSTSSSGGYNVKCGTSMSSPTVTGIVALILQDFRASFPGLEDPRPSTMKVFLAHTAADRGNVGPDYQFGYGSVRVKDAIDFVRLAQFTEQEISQGATHTYDIEVAGNEPELKFTLAWDDPPGTPNVDPALVNQLDVRVIDPTGGVHNPWVLDPFNPGAPATKSGPNTRDNIEQVQVNNPMAGTWTVEVIATNVPEGPQAYSLCGSPNLDVSILSVGLASNVPDLVPAGDSLEVDVTITTVNDTLVDGSEKLFYRFDGGSFTEVALVENGDVYTATIPGTGCDSMPEFYVAAEGVENGVVFNPGEGPAGPHTYGIGEILVVLEDDIEDDSGWTAGVGGDTATTGQWERGNPVGTEAQPEDDHTPTGTDCFFTGQGQQGGGLGDNDVDGGFTTLISPVFDLSDTPDAVMSYWRWYSNNTGNAPNTDVFVIDISDDGGNSWTNVETVGPGGQGTSGGWIQHSFVVSDFVDPTDQIQLRFIAEDDPSDGDGSLVEAAIDDLKVETFFCESDCYGDFNGDGELSILDFVAYQNAFQGGDLAADCDGSGSLDVLDFVCFQAAFVAGCN